MPQIPVAPLIEVPAHPPEQAQGSRQAQRQLIPARRQAVVLERPSQCDPQIVMVHLQPAQPFHLAGSLQLLPGSLNLAGKTGLRGLMALVRRCRLFITNDSGPMHISAALGVPTLAVFGSTDYIATGPFGEGHRIIREPVNCSPCLKRTCPLKHYKCMEQVTPQRVLKAAKDMLEGGVG